MATATASLFISLDPQFHHHHHHHHHHNHFKPPHSLPFTSKHTHPLFTSLKSTPLNLITPLSTSSSSSILENEQNPFHITRFLTTPELQNLNFLQNYSYHQELKSGSLFIRVMKPDELDATVALLSESFAESMLLPKAYVKVLGFLVKQYLMERRSVMPNAATLIGFLKESDEEDLKLAGTVEVCFNQRGVNGSPPTPTAPKNMPYISNMTVKKSFRRMIDTVPFNMYTRAGYIVYKTDSILTLLTLQRRKHLMRKYLEVFNSYSETDIPKEELYS